MPAHMAELPDYPGSIALTNAQRHHAAVTLAEHCQPDRHLLAYFLTQLGLAEHHEDGTFTARSDREERSWFSGRNDRSGTLFTLPVSQLDDCR